ncbi:type IV pilus twitching motility protein PilT [Patescibacteria group bacterium]|nr:type IV pilus twitching motility protein PilT [Patescibacteria group bacterium]MCL5010318.1 type IV pilus twitching motility protein PilT [Patescibacteria group bacterium]
MNIQDLLSLTIKNNASDLHLLSSVPPVLRIDGSLSYIGNLSPLTVRDIEAMVFSIITPEQKELLSTNKELDFSVGFSLNETTGRFRVNAYFEKGSLAVAFRFLSSSIRTLEELKLPKVLHSFASLKQGLVLVAGPTGHGKSTTLASIINEINLNKASHILTIEDPVEYVYPKGKSIVSQRELSIDTHSWAMALRSALREDPDVVLVGEMRDPETMEAAITIAETGHVVFSTLHTNSASQSIDRIVGVFPPYQQPQIRIQLAATLKGIVSQRLMPQIAGGRVPAVEVLVGTPAVASNIRDGKTHLIDSIIQTSQDAGMITLESSLASLVLAGSITLEMARSYALHQEELLRMVG